MLGSHQVVFGRGTATTAHGDSAVTHVQAAQVQNHFVTIDIRHNDVGNDHVIGLILVKSLGFLTVFCRFHIVALDFKSGLEHQIKLLVVINNQDRRH